MIGRYARPEMARLWDVAAQYASWLEVELAVAEAMAAAGRIPAEALAQLQGAAPPDPGRVAALERETGHEIVAFLEALEEQVGPAARYLHLGLTSSDVLDTSLAVRCVRATDLLLEGCGRLIDLLAERALEFRDLPMVGRTHGIHAEPITLGLKFLRWRQEFVRGRERLERARQVIGFGKVSGAVGTYSTVDPAIEEGTCQRLGLQREPVSSQIVPRDRHAEFLAHLAVVAASVENVAGEIRGLQRTEVGELEEPFGERQKGSSAMPHKRNPVRCENLVGLARLMRAYAGAGFEDVALWHERDISHSSVERVALADACILLDFMLHRLAGVVAGLQVDREAVRRNLAASQGLVFSGRVLEALIEAGLPRTTAYGLVQAVAARSRESGEPFRKLLGEDPEIRRHLDEDDLDRACDLEGSLGHVRRIFERILGEAATVAPAPGDGTG